LYQAAGKTGTAQAIGIKKDARYDASKIAERYRDHALYMAFAPADKPKIALAMIVENAGFGAQSAAPIARKVFDYWLLGKREAPTEANQTPVSSTNTAANTNNTTVNTVNQIKTVSTQITP
jgi:penicillin-binding protein 2